MSRWKIKPARSSKDLIKQPECVKLGILPPLNGRILMIGASGSGKSVLLQNIVTEERFYNNKKTFNHTFLISPTAGNDDIQQALNVDEKCIVEDLEDAPACLEHIINDQKKKIKKAGGSHKAPKLLVIFDDVIGSKDFLNTKSFIDCFIRGRHANLTIMLCSQHLMRVPRVCRLQATCLFIFACNRQDTEIIAEHYAPPQMTKRQFLRLVDDATSERFSFLSIFTLEPWEKRFRRNLDQILNLDYYRGLK